MITKIHIEIKTPVANYDRRIRNIYRQFSLPYETSMLNFKPSKNAFDLNTL